MTDMEKMTGFCHMLARLGFDPTHVLLGASQFYEIKALVARGEYYRNHHLARLARRNQIPIDLEFKP